MEISNKSIIVTGGANGIGKALAKAFKNAGAAYVLIADLDEIENLFSRPVDYPVLLEDEGQK